MNAPHPASKAEQLKEVNRSIQRRLIGHIKNGRTTDMAEAPLRVSRDIFVDPNRLEAEKQHLFLKMPLVAGLSGDIPEAGDALLFDGAGPSIIIIRDKEGKANAFLNMCTHRGSQLLKACGKHETISCPFHGWTFDTKGRLVGHPGSEGFNGIDRAGLGLIRVPCAELHGLLFVKAQPGNEAIDAEVGNFLGDFAHQLSLLELENYKPGKSGIMKAKGNWKYVAETFGEGYHFAALHPTSLGKTHYNNVAVYDRFGRHHRVCFVTRNYLDLAKKPESEWPPLDTAVYSIFPNTMMLVGCPNPGAVFVQLFRIYPGGLSETNTHFTLYASGKVFESVGRQAVEGAYDLAVNIIETEDFTIAGNAQRALGSSPADFKVTYGRNEIALQHYQRNLAEAIGMPI